MEIVVTACCPLGSANSPLPQIEVVKKIGEKKNVTTFFFLSIRAHMDQTGVLSKSVTEECTRGE